ncbi:MAG: polysaccharide biosynthesis tyrosine autokinase [Kiritimatiellae bacterium]|nr:polysaccharide biosynthesis tyrosine autokinase [Kiritimatiellia bacterium]
MSEDTQTQTLHFLDYWRVIRDRKDVILAVALLTIVTGTIYTYMMPQKFRATTQIQVSEDAPDVDPFFVTRNTASTYNPFFLLTQEKIIRSRRVLLEVIRILNLQRVWGAELNEDKSPVSQEMALEIMQRALRVEQDRDTLLMNISATTRDAKQSAEIANTVASEYRKWRYNEQRRTIQQAIDAMGNELKKQQAKVVEAENKLEQIRKDQGISLLGGIAGPNSIREGSARLSVLEQQRSAARVEMLVREARMKQLEGLEGEELMEAAVYIVPDQMLARVRAQLLEARVQRELVTQNGVLGPEHPDVKKVQAAVDELQSQVDSLLKGLKEGLRVDYETSKAHYEAVDAELQQYREMDIEEITEKLVPFNRASEELQLQRDILNALRARVTQSGIEVEVPRTTVRVIEEAIPPQRPSSPLVFLNILLSVVLGFLAGIGLAFFVEYLDVSIKTVDEVEKYLGLSAIAVIPQQIRPLNEPGVSASQGESYRSLRTALLLAAKEKRLKSFVTVSGGVGEGKSTTIFNLAYVCAEQGHRILLVDADLRRPVQHKFVGASNSKGLINVLTGEGEPEEYILRDTGVENLALLPAGRLRRGSLGIMTGERIRALIEKVSGDYDYIFFDSPPVLGVTDSSILANEVDGVMFVVQYRKYPKIVSIRAKRMLESAGANIVGVVLNNINIMRDDYYYYYHHYSTKKYYDRIRDADKEEAAEKRKGKA